MSARNGDKSGFKRERRKQVARRKLTHELLGCTAETFKSGEMTVSAQLRSVSA